MWNAPKVEKYPYEEGEWTINVSTGTVANDVAKVSQSTGAINPYMVRVYFNTIR